MEDTKDVDRPDFFSIQSYEEFSKYYWYRLELSRICKKIGRVSTGSKSELNNEIRAYFMERDADTDQEKSRNEAPSQAVSSGHGKPSKPALARKICDPTPEAPLLDCGFAFNPWFREYFAELTGIRPFRFTADMATAWRKVKQDHDQSFTIAGMLAVYEGTSTYVAYDDSACQWNQFFKDFCADVQNHAFPHKLSAAAALWRTVCVSTEPKIYTPELGRRYRGQLETD